MNKASPIIKAGLRTIKEAGYDLPDQQLFPIWVIAMIHFDGNLDQASLEDAYACTQALVDEDGSSGPDLGGYFHAEEANQLFLYYFRQAISGEDAPSAADAKALGTVLHALYSKIDSYSELPESRKAACEALRKTLTAKGTIHLRGVSIAKWKSDHERTAKHMVPEAIADSVTVELLSGEFFLQLVDLQTSDLTGEDIQLEIFAGTTGQVLSLADQGVKGVGDAYTALLSAFSLADVAAKWGDRLFDRNVRRHLGYSTKVNKNIMQSLTTPDGRRSFWYGHNGITILCDDLALQGGSRSRPTAFLLTNPQIVNGCQTTVAIKNGVGSSEERKSPRVDFGISARIIQLKGDPAAKSEIANEIALKTNTQLTVTDADLKSNDKVQQLFARNLAVYGKGWFYIRKRGDWLRLQHKPIALAKYFENENDYRRIDPQAYQQAWRSYTGTPASAITAKGDVWTLTPLYDQVFSEERRACDIVLSTSMLDWLCHVLAVDKHNNCLAATVHCGLEEHVLKLKKSKVRCAAHCLALFGKLVQAAYGEPAAYPEEHIETITNRLKRGNSVKTHWIAEGRKKSWAVLGEAFELILQVLSQFCRIEIDRANELTKADTTLFSALKRPESLEKMWKDLRSERRLSFKELVTPRQE